MKKFLLIALTILLTLTSVFAEETQFSPEDLIPTANNDFAAILDGSFPRSARSLGMGMAGVSVSGRSDSYYLNPALLARKALVSIPYAQVTLYHPYELLVKDEDGNSIVTDIIDAVKSNNMEEIAGPAVAFLETIKSGKGKLAEVEAGINLGGGGFAIGIHIKDTIHTYGYGTGGLDANLYDELNVNVLANLGLKFNITNHVALSVGVSGGLGVLGYTDLIGAQTVSGMIGGSGSTDPQTLFMEKVPLALGWYIPLNVGVNLELPLGFSVGAVGRNLLGSAVGLKMQAYKNVNEFLGDGNVMSAISGVFSKEDFKISMAPKFDVGFGWQFKNGFFAPTIAADFVDVVGLFKDLSVRNLVGHLRVGAEIRLLSFLDVRAGLNQGYWTVGAGIDLWAIKLDVAYYWQEFGDTVGDYGLDALTIRANIGFDR